MATKATKAPQVKKPAAEGPTAVYEVTSPLKHDGVDYAVGEGIELTEAQAAPLLGHTVQATSAD